MGLSGVCLIGTVVSALYIRIKSRSYRPTSMSAGATDNLESYDKVPNIESGDDIDNTGRCTAYSADDA